MDTSPATLQEAIVYFADPDRAHDFLVKMRWPNGVACPRMGCGSANVAAIKSRKKWRCRECNRQFSVKVGTIFEDSPIGLDRWLPAFWLLTNAKNGISSYEIVRGLKVCQKTAWFMLHRIRCAMQDETFELLDTAVEVDETYVGGLAKNMHLEKRAKLRGTGGIDKTAVMGIARRHGNVRAWVVPNTQAETLQGKIAEHVAPGTTVYTDAAKAYLGLKQRFTHYTINHAVEYVNGHISTNYIESFWSVFKRTVKGTYVAPRPKHLQRYVEEQVFRFNARKGNDGDRFPVVVKQAEGKRLTWKVLTAKV
jgi:transposase-like protein